MTDYRRLYVKGGTYFFTVVTQERRPIFSKEEIVHLLRKAFEKVMTDRPFVMEAITVLPDHVHCLWTLPDGDSDFSTRWKEIKYRFSISYGGPLTVSESMKKKKEKGLWQRRFWEHSIRDQEDLNRHLDYIHYNPVKHGLAKRAIEWPHSSFKEFVEKGIYEEDWGSMPPVSIKDMDFE